MRWMQCGCSVDEVDEVYEVDEVSQIGHDADKALELAAIARFTAVRLGH